MSTRSLPIKYGSPIACRRWHDIETTKHEGDRTEAMNQPGGIVLVRTTIQDKEWSGEDSFCSTTVAASMIRLKDTMVAKRWQPRVVDAWIDEDDHRHHPGMILVDEEYALVPVPKLTHRLASEELGLLRTDSFLKTTEFRWFDADAHMPRPTEEQVRACVESLPAPSEVESLRSELDKMRERYHDAEQRVSEARGAKEDEEPWVWSDDDTAKAIDGFGNAMVVRITGGHLRALLACQSDKVHGVMLMALALVMRLAKQLPSERLASDARALCVEIAACTDPRVLLATNHDGTQRTPPEVAERMFGLDVARELWSGETE
jgi:hypothetical protein